MLTTIIGTYPKPENLPVRDRSRSEESGADSFGPTAGDDEAQGGHGGRLDDPLDRATIEAVGEQVKLGVDIPNEGAIRRGDPLRYLGRHLEGVEVAPLTDEQRHGDAPPSLPGITAPVRAGPAFLVRDWRVAQSATRRPVAITLPGPTTISAGVTDDVYQGDAAARGVALAEALNVEIRRLADAGCPVIQVSEPAFLRDPELAHAFGLEHLDRCFHRVPRPTERVVHLGPGRPDAPDAGHDRPAAPPETYADLAAVLQDVAVDAVALDDAHSPKDLALLERFARSKVILGVIDVAGSEIEEAEAVRARLLQALGHIDPHRLIAAPDGGLGLLDRRLARQKLRVLTEAAGTL